MKLLAPLLSLLVWLSAVAVRASGLSDVTVARIRGAATDCTDYTHAIQLDNEGGVFLLYLLTETSLSVRLEVARERWVALGVAPDERGKMVGSDAIVGLPLEAVSSSNPGKYYMVGEAEDDVFLRGRNDQTLQNADVWQENGSTFLAFTKLLDEGNDQLSITTTGTNYFLWAFGLEQELGLHDEDEGCGAFAVDAASTLCIPSATAPVEDEDETTAETPDQQDTSENEGAAAPGEQQESTEEEDEEEDLAEGEDSGEEDAKSNIFDDTSSSTNTSLTCDDYQYDVQIDELLRMEYVVQNDLISVRLELAAEAWLALGLQPQGRMIGGEAVIGLPDEPVSVGSNPGEYSMTSESEVGVFLMASQSGLVSGDLVQQGGTTVMTFTKKLSENDKLSMIADGSSYTTFIWAYGFDNALRLHKRDGSFQLRLEQCTHNTGLQVSSVAASSESKYSYSKTQAMWIAHGFLGLAAWAILSPVAFSASWLRSLLPDGWWFKIHFYSNILVLLLTLVTFVLAVLLYKSEGKDHFTGTHEAIGLIIVMVVVLQAAAGIMRPAAPKTDDQEQAKEAATSIHDAEETEHHRQHETDGEYTNSSLSSSEEEQPKGNDSSSSSSPDFVGKKKVRVAWEVAHKLIGYIVVVLGLWQVQSGIALYAEEYDSTDYSPAFWIYIGLALTTLVLLTVYMRVKAVQ